MATVFDGLTQAGAFPLLVSVHGRQSTDGDAIVYNPLGVTGSALAAVWTPDVTEPEYSRDGKQQIRRGELVLSPADVTSPDSRDTFTIDSTTWALTRVISNVGLLVVAVETRTRLRIGGGTTFRER